MSATAVVPEPRLRNDFAAGGRHFLTRLRMTARDPFALGLLAFAGAVTVPLWAFGLRIHPLFARDCPWPGGLTTFTGPAPTLFQLAIRPPDPAVAFSLLLGAALVAGAALGRETAHRLWPAAPVRGMPALPLGPRARVVADVLVAASCVLIARAFVLWLGGVRLGRTLFGHDPALATYPEVARLGMTLLPSLRSEALAYTSSFVMSTILGSLLSFPLVLAWATTMRLDARGLVKLAVAALLVFGAASVGAMAHVGSALLVCVGLSAFLLVRLDDGRRAGSALPARPLRFRVSAGPAAQLRRDAWQGPVERLWWVLLLAVALPLTLTAIGRTSGFDSPAARTIWLRGAASTTAFLLQWPTLLALTLFPFGLTLVPSATPARGLFSGAFLRSWGALPVWPERAIRAVYAHGLLAAGLAWLMLCLQVRLLGARLGPALYELPVVLLMPGLAVCEAVGDRRRGLIAVGALAAFQFGLPFAFALLVDALGAVPHFVWKGMPLGIAGYAVGLAGALPPLVHLRGRAGAASRRS
jgi:hypothetical protein